MLTIRNPWGGQPFTVERIHASLGNLHAAYNPSGGYVYFVSHAGENHAIAQRVGYSRRTLEDIRAGIDGGEVENTMNRRAVEAAGRVLGGGAK